MHHYFAIAIANIGNVSCWLSFSINYWHHMFGNYFTDLYGEHVMGLLLHMAVCWMGGSGIARTKESPGHCMGTCFNWGCKAAENLCKAWKNLRVNMILNYQKQLS